MARGVGFTIRPETPVGALAWIDDMTNPDFGKVGYRERGGAPFRFAEIERKFPANEISATAAAGVFVRALLRRAAGEDAAKDEYVEKGADMLRRRPPKWDVNAGSIDLWCWWWGSMATQPVKDAWDGWYGATAAALIGAQRTSQSAAGSWDVEDPWSHVGGEVYVTAVACLALQTPWRTARLADPRSR